MLAVGEGVRDDPAAPVDAHGRDPVLEGEVAARLGLEVDAHPAVAAIRGRDVDGHRVVVERECTDRRRVSLVALLLLPARTPGLGVEVAVVEDDVAYLTQAAVPEVGDEPLQALGVDLGGRRIIKQNKRHRSERAARRTLPWW